MVHVKPKFAFFTLIYIYFKRNKTQVLLPVPDLFLPLFF
nr:MAG TPA: hypothetical protein [Inoviridae sp.]